MQYRYITVSLQKAYRNTGVGRSWLWYEYRFRAKEKEERNSFHKGQKKGNCPKFKGRYFAPCLIEPEGGLLIRCLRVIGWVAGHYLSISEMGSGKELLINVEKVSYRSSFALDFIFNHLAWSWTTLRLNYKRKRRHPSISQLEPKELK